MRNDRARHHIQVANIMQVTGSKTPLTLFSAKHVTNMTRDALEDVAGEDAVLKRREDNLERKIKKLQEGKKSIR
jgi:cell division protein FtsB